MHVSLLLKPAEAGVTFAPSPPAPIGVNVEGGGAGPHPLPPSPSIGGGGQGVGACSAAHLPNYHFTGVNAAPVSAFATSGPCRSVRAMRSDAADVTAAVSTRQLTPAARPGEASK